MHAFALFHDDVMDDAASRRGAPTTHVVFADHHADGGWAGEARRFGEGVAILVGDLAFVYADQLMAARARRGVGGVERAAHRAERRPVARHRRQRAPRARTVAKAERICRYKSGKYTIERPLHLGAVAGRRPSTAPSCSALLSAYGLPLGDAFQMRDDVIGVFGDPLRTGKPVGGDLREGKPTPLLARAVGRGDAGAARRARPRRRPAALARRRRPDPGGDRRHRRARPPWRRRSRAHRRGVAAAIERPRSPRRRATNCSPWPTYVSQRET